MKTKIILSALAISAVALVFMPRKAWAIDLIDPMTGQGGNEFLILPNGSDKQRASAVAHSLNVSRYGGWFNDPKHSLADVLPIWRIESGFKPEALNLNDGGAGNHAYGIGQVLGSTAGDFYSGEVADMLRIEIGAQVSMDYMKWSYEFLQNRLGRHPTKNEWVGAYNAGVGAVLAGRLPVAYIAKFYANALLG